jgi:hypothetical protein
MAKRKAKTVTVTDPVPEAGRDILGELFNNAAATKRRRTRKAKPEPVRAPLLRTVDVPVVPLGERLGLNGWTHEQVKESLCSTAPSAIACWHDCHPFDWTPCRIPLKYDPRFGVYYSAGHFCSWQCAKAHGLSNPGVRNETVSLIALEANRSRRRYVGYEKSIENAFVLGSVSSKESLQMFGGSTTIEEFRKGCLRFDGTVIGGEPQLPHTSLQSIRNQLVPPAFIDKSKVQIFRCVCIGGAPHPISKVSKSLLSHQQQQHQQKKQNAINNQSIQERITSRANEVNLNSDKYTLMSAMGLRVSSDRP